MKIKFIFIKDKVKLFSTNDFRVTPDRLRHELNNPNSKILSYILNDLPLTRKLVNFIPIYGQNQKTFLDSEEYPFQTNYYPSPNDAYLKQAREEMNQTISELVDLGYPDSLYNLELSGDDQEQEKLNQLHFFFESEVIKIDEFSENYDLKRHALERINNLVHFIEPNERMWSDFGFVIRKGLFYEDSGFVKLSPADYEYFRNPQGGELVCDFSTIGKDLQSCYITNDIELIKNKQVKQQEYLTDYLFLLFNSSDMEQTKSIDQLREPFYKWCEENNVGDYIDYKQPMYNPGRHILGSSDDNIITSEDFYENIFSTHPFCLGWVLCDDDGNIIGL